jgi:prefoldin alpha subunit
MSKSHSQRPNSASASAAASASAELDEIAKSMNIPGPESFEKQLAANIPANPGTNSTKSSKIATAASKANSAPNISSKTTTDNQRRTGSYQVSSLPSSEEPQLAESENEAKIRRYQDFIQNKLQVTLQQTLAKRDAVYEMLGNYLELSKNIELIEKNKLVAIKTQVDLGCDFFVKAEIPPENAKLIIIDIGLGFWAELTLHEATEFIKQKDIQLNKKAEKLTQQAASISSQIKMIYEGIASLMELNKYPQDKPRRSDLSY